MEIAVAGMDILRLLGAYRVVDALAQRKMCFHQ